MSAFLHRGAALPVAFFLLVTLATGLMGGAPARGAETTKTPGGAKAADNFQWFCAQCHGIRGDGKGVNNTAKLPVSPRNLTDPKDIAQFSNEDIVRTITHGGGVNDLSAIMPPWGNRLTKEEILDLVAFIRTLCRCKFDPKAKERALREKGLRPPSGGDPRQETSP